MNAANFFAMRPGAPNELTAQTSSIRIVEDTNRDVTEPAKALSSAAGLFPFFKTATAILIDGLQKVRIFVTVHRTRKRMRLCETISLGDKRFLAIIQIDDEQILVGGSASSVAMLAKLAEPQSFSSVMEQQLGEKSFA